MSHVERFLTAIGGTAIGVKNRSMRSRIKLISYSSNAATTRLPSDNKTL